MNVRNNNIVNKSTTNLVEYIRKQHCYKQMLQEYIHTNLRRTTRRKNK